MTHLFITGCRGQLGTELILQAAAGGFAVTGVDLPEVDITDQAAVQAAVAEFAASAKGNPAIVMNPAAYTAVDRAETDTDLAWRVNETGAKIVAQAAAAHQLPLIHISTDYVFSGDGDRPYEVTDQPDPKNVYGASKLAGELAACAAQPDTRIVRTAGVYGAYGANFVKTMARLEATKDTITVVDDQCGSPTYTGDLAAGLLAMATVGVRAGTYHATGAGQASWCEFARAIFAELGADPQRVQPITTADYPTPARRPTYSVLSNKAWVEAGLTALPDWRDALRRAFAEHGAAFRPAP